MLKSFLLSLLASSSFAATFFVDPGSSRFGNTTFNLSSRATITTSGSVGSDQRAAIYYDTHGALTIALPPGISGTCSVTPCHIFTTGTGGSHGAAGGHQFATNASEHNYNWVDPIFNTTASTNGAYSLLANERLPTSFAWHGLMLFGSCVLRGAFHDTTSMNQSALVKQ
jgi:hypothetical protein